MFFRVNPLSSARSKISGRELGMEIFFDFSFDDGMYSKHPVKSSNFTSC